MFANRYTALIDACALADALKRDFLLSLCEAEFFRIRWSEELLEETRRAISKMLQKRGFQDHNERALKVVVCMKTAFPQAMVTDFRSFDEGTVQLPDPGDQHVLSAALKAQAQNIVTENLRDFPPSLLDTLNLEARSADDFIADTIALDTGRAIQAVR
ncbi:MAG: PIN domain-containing protein [Pseudomonadota bacterium]